MSLVFMVDDHPLRSTRNELGSAQNGIYGNIIWYTSPSLSDILLELEGTEVSRRKSEWVSPCTNHVKLPSLSLRKKGEVTRTLEPCVTPSVDDGNAEPYDVGILDLNH